MKILIFLFSLPVAVFAQSIQDEIDIQVWIPFMEAYEANNSTSFLGLHSKDLVRVIRDNETILDYNRYLSMLQKSEERHVARQNEREIAFSFLERIANDSLAFEVGYYRGKSKQPDGQIRTYYGKFHVVLRKEYGIWKILLDSDTSLDDTIAETKFNSGTILLPKPK